MHSIVYTISFIGQSFYNNTSSILCSELTTKLLLDERKCFKVRILKIKNNKDRVNEENKRNNQFIQSVVLKAPRVSVSGRSA